VLKTGDYTQVPTALTVSSRYRNDVAALFHWRPLWIWFRAREPRTETPHILKRQWVVHFGAGPISDDIRKHIVLITIPAKRIGGRQRESNSVEGIRFKFALQDNIA
jgi:hypothetical protein